MVALATELEARGCDLCNPLWSAKVLMEAPELIYQVHYDYFAAGAQCAINASYQATPQGFAARGLSEAESLALIDAGVDLLACETQPSLPEMAALLQLLREFPTITAWFSFTLRNAQHISDGTPLRGVVALLDNHPQVVAMRVNGVALESATAALAHLSSLTALPLVVYPNSGEHYDANAKRWSATGEQACSLTAHLSA